MKSTVVDESLSSFKPMYCSREYQASTRLIQQYEKSTLSIIMFYFWASTYLAQASTCLMVTNLVSLTAVSSCIISVSISLSFLGHELTALLI